MASAGQRSARAAFLAGEGTLTLAEVQEWATELGDVSMPQTLDPATPLMVSVVDRYREEE